MRARELATPAAIALLLGVAAVRVACVVDTPLVDDDSVAIVVAALDMAQSGAPSPSYPLPVAILAGLFAAFGEHLWLARLPGALASLGLVLLLLRTGGRAGLAAAALFAALPIGVVYSTIVKPYALMTLLITGAAVLHADAAKRECGRRAALAGVLLACAFACYTFALLAVLPLVVLARKQRRAAWIAIAAFALPAAALLGWRFTHFGWGAFNDFVIDWRFPIATAIWSQQWIGLTDLWHAGAGWLIPLVFYARRASAGEVGRYGALLLLVLVPFWAANPINHYPRVLLPALPFACLFAGAVAAQLAEDDRPALLAWLLTGAASWLAPAPRDAGAVALSAAGVALAFPLLRAVARRTGVGAALGVWCCVALVVGSLSGWLALREQATVFQPRIELLRRAGATGVVGGGDVAAIASHGAVPGLLDLEEHELRRALDGELIAVLRQRRLSHVVIARDRGELTAALGAISDRAAALVARFDDPELFDRLADNDHGALLRARGVPVHALSTEQRARVAAFHPSTARVPPDLLLAFDGAAVVARPGPRRDLRLLVKAGPQVFADQPLTEATRVPLSRTKGVEAWLLDAANVAVRRIWIY